MTDPYERALGQAPRVQSVPLTECARCRERPPMHPFTGCLCEPCEDAIEGMTQAELDADYESHAPPAVSNPTPPE
jgi:hypothetical protein